MMPSVREAALRPAAAEFYPDLPARMWTSATHLAELVTRYRGLCGKVASRSYRVLSDAHFVFRDRGSRALADGQGGRSMGAGP
jgi:hypothetical protein